MATDRFATLVRFDSRANLVCLLPEVSSDKGWDSALLEPYLQMVLWLEVSAVFCTRLRYGVHQRLHLHLRLHKYQQS